jgi:probable rRNA maturation factor
MMVEVEIEAAGWAEAVPGVADIAGEAARAALGALDGGEVAILLTDDATVRSLNARFRATDAPTNVLAFPAGPNAEAGLGDIALALGVCEREARVQGKPLANHLRHLVIHGVLHLLGYDHHDDDEAMAMESRERELLAQLGVADPYALDDAGGCTDDNADLAKHGIAHG